jgi:hypothetical protein
MLEALKGLDIFDPKFYIPVIVGAIALLIIIKVAKNLFKIALLIAVLLLVVLVYLNLPAVQVSGSTATLKIKGQEYVIDAKDVKIEQEMEEDGKQKLYLVSGGKKIVELPFSMEYAKKFILEKLNITLGEQEESDKDIKKDEKKKQEKEITEHEPFRPMER